MYIKIPLPGNPLTKKSLQVTGLFFIGCLSSSSRNRDFRIQIDILNGMQ